MVEKFANSRDPNQTPRSAAFDLILHCLPVNRLGVSSFQLVKDFCQADIYFNTIQIITSGILKLMSG